MCKLPKPASAHKMDMVIATSRQLRLLDLNHTRADFPILAQTVHGKPLIYFDNAASTQKPRAVIEAQRHYYEHDNANIHRAVHTLSQRATHGYEQARETVRKFINARDAAECIFTRGTTDSINLIASCLGRSRLSTGDEVLLSELEHHSNIVPWQLAAQATGSKVIATPINNAGEILIDEFTKRLSLKTKAVSISWVSNALGSINPIAEMIRLTRRHAPNAVFVVDAAQWIAHGVTDVLLLDCDFLVFSGHKLYGPTGVGVLYGKRAVLDALPPYQGGGDMIETVSFEKTTYAALPNKFEAGTPNIAGVIGLAAAIDYVQSIGLADIAAYEHDLLQYATARINEVPTIRVIGTAASKAGVISFLLDGVAALDIGVKLDEAGIAVRTGHHCCMPLMKRLGVEGTVRASFAFYNTKQEVDALVEILKWIAKNHKPAAAAPPACAMASPQMINAISFAPRSAESPKAAADALAEDIALFDDAAGRSQFVIDLGDRLPKSFGQLKAISQRLPGCMSEVYVIGRAKPGSTNVLEFAADANADIVRGLIAIMQRLFSGQRADDVRAFDVEAFFRRIGLDQFITTQRRNGLGSLVAKLRQLATDIATKEV